MSEEKKFKCPECDRTFDTPQGAAVHRTRAHGANGLGKAKPVKAKKAKKKAKALRPPNLQDWWLVDAAVAHLRRQNVPAGAVIVALGVLGKQVQE